MCFVFMKHEHEHFDTLTSIIILVELLNIVACVSVVKRLTPIRVRH